MPQILARVVEPRTVDVRTFIVGDGEHWATNEDHVLELLLGMNQLFKQVGIVFSLVDNQFINDPSHLRIGKRSGSWVGISNLCGRAVGTGGLELYFVDDIEDANGLCSEFGIVLRASAPCNAVAHEICHACGLEDTFYTAVYDDFLNGGTISLTLPDHLTKPNVPKDWSSSTDEGYYSQETTRAVAVAHNLMFGKTNRLKADVHYGNSEAITYRNLFEPTFRFWYKKYVITTVTNGYFEAGAKLPISK